MEAPKAKFGPPLRLGENNGGLAFHIFNPEGTQSVLLLHGAGTGAPEWDTTIPHFSNQYHLLVPDLPLHNDSTNMNLENTAIDTGNLLRDLLRSEGRQGQAHIIGLSMGAHIGRRLAVQCPEVVKDCFLSGYTHIEDLNWIPYLQQIVFAAEYIGTKIPKNWMDGIEHADTATPHTLEHLKKIWPIISDEGVKGNSWRARTLVVAATKGGLVPTNDPIKDARELALLGQQENPETMAVQNKKMRHAWNRQDPKLFAKAVMCWIESKPLPDSFEPIYIPMEGTCR